MLLCACPGKEEGHSYITIVNKSGEKISYQFAWEKVLNIYQDTVFYCNKTSEGFIDNNSSFILECPIRVKNWETDLGNSHYIQFLVMDGNIYEQYYKESCDTVRKYVPILHTYRLTLSDLQRMNWTVVYPLEEKF